MFLSTENTIFQGHHLRHMGLSYHHNLGILMTSRLTCVCSLTNPLASCRLVFLKVNISSAVLFVCRWQAANTFAGFNRELLRSFGINHFELQLCHRVEKSQHPFSFCKPFDSSRRCFNTWNHHTIAGLQHGFPRGIIC